MSARVKGFVVMLEEDLHEDDAERLAGAIFQLRRVARVAPLPVETDDYLARERARREILGQLLDVLKSPEGSFLDACLVEAHLKRLLAREECEALDVEAARARRSELPDLAPQPQFICETDAAKLAP